MGYGPTRVPLPFVSVDVSAVGGGSPDAVAALIEACDLAFSRGTCGTRDNAPGSREPDRRVSIEWADADQLSAHVELRVDANAAPERTRDLEFQRDDSLIERWRSAGYVAGTLADESLTAAEPPKPSPAPASPVSPAPRRARFVPQPPRALVPAPPTLPPTWVDLQAIAGPTLSGLRIGALVRGGYTITAPVFATFSFRYSFRDANGVELSWIVPSIGAGVRTSPVPDRLDLDLRLELIGEAARASASDPQTGRVDADHRWAIGFIAGGDVGWRFAPWGEVTLGGDVAVTGRPIELRVQGRDRGTVSAESASLLAGFRLTFR